MLLISTQVFAGPRLYVFDCGLINLDSLEMFGLQEHESHAMKMCVPRYVVQHEDGLLLWDSSLPKAFTASSTVAAGANPRAEPGLVVPRVHAFVPWLLPRSWRVVCYGVHSSDTTRHGHPQPWPR